MTARFARLKSRATLVHLSLGALLACGTFGVRAQEQPQVVITLERTVCYGTCPAYTLRITGDGSVEYEGMRYVRVIGKATARISPDVVRRLVTEFERIGYFDLEDKYTAMVTDNPTTTTSIRIDTRFKRVIDYVAGPQALKELEQRIDEVAGSARWVSVDAETVRQLRQGGWTGRTREAAGYLEDAVRRGDEDTVRELVDSGVDLNGDVSPFFYARTRGMVKLLIDSGANVNHVGQMRGTPLVSAAPWQSPEIVAALLDAKADVNAAASGTTALMEAVSARKAETVRLLLRAGAKERAP